MSDLSDFFSSEWGKFWRQEFCFLSSLQIFSFLSTFSGWLESCNLSIESSFCFMHAYQVADVTEGRDRWPVVKLMLPPVFLALTSENLVVTESSFKNVICWATWKASLLVIQSESVSVLKLSLKMVQDLFVDITHYLEEKWWFLLKGKKTKRIILILSIFKGYEIW